MEEKELLVCVMDARYLSFLNNSFDAVTSFFTMMFIDNKDHINVFKEIYRVLKDDGEFILWDCIIPPYAGDIKDVFVIQLEVLTTTSTIKTGYGVSRIDKYQDVNYFVRIGEETGFKTVKLEVNDKIFKIVFKKV